MTDPLDPTKQAPATREMPVPPVSDPPGDDELAGLQREIEGMRDRHLRLAAEFDNFRRRAIRERQEAGWRAQGELISAFMAAFDDLERFGNVEPSSTDAKTVIEGVQMVERKFNSVLADFGFGIVEPTGQPFDPAKHEAISTFPATSPDEDGIVGQTYQVGYVYNDTVLRPARVIVKQWNGEGSSAS